MISRKEVVTLVQDLMRVLDDAGVAYEVLPHARTDTAVAEAEALGISPSEVAKTLIVTTPAGYVRAVLPASERLDLQKVRDVLGDGKRIHLATEEDLARDYAEFELGAVPPLTGARHDRVLLERRLAEQGSVVIEAGSHEQSIRIPTADLLRLTQASVADICTD